MRRNKFQELHSDITIADSISDLKSILRDIVDKIEENSIDIDNLTDDLDIEEEFEAR